MRTRLMDIRDVMINTYQKIRFIINPVIKFFLAWLIFAQINVNIGCDTRFMNSTIVVLLSAICAFLPLNVTTFLAFVLSMVHIYKANLFMAVFVLIAFLILYIFMLRFTPKQSIVAVLIPVLSAYNLHYAVPLILGSLYNPVMILPCISGVAVKYIIDVVKVASDRTVEMTVDGIVEFFTGIVDIFIDNKQMIVMMVVFSLVIVVIFVIRKLSFEYSLPISIGAGIVTNIIAFLIAELKLGTVVEIGTLIRMTIVAGIIAYIVEFMRRVLDYTAVERLQFEDEDYYYYVKAVPKLKSSFDRRSGRISEEEYEEEEYEEELEEEEESEEYEEEPEEYEEEERLEEDDESAGTGYSEENNSLENERSERTGLFIKEYEDTEDK